MALHLSSTAMNDMIAVLGAERLLVIGALMLVAVCVTLLACVPTAYVSRVVQFIRRLS
jgi:hypothetical protein